jgi:uncharacterized protein YehS (DUF1456 family)
MKVRLVASKSKSPRNFRQCGTVLFEIFEKEANLWAFKKIEKKYSFCQDEHKDEFKKGVLHRKRGGGRPDENAALAFR